MSTDSKGRPYPPGRGFAWRGDWQERLRLRLSELGYGSLVEYSSSRPLATFAEMIDELGPGDFAQIQLQRELVRESEIANQSWSCALHMLVKFLRDMPRDWQDQGGFALVERLVAWQSVLPTYMHKNCREVTTSLLQDKTIPAGWVPIGVDDVYLHPHLSAWPADRLIRET